MRSIYFLVMGLLLGYLAEQQKQLRAEKAVVARILGKARVDEGLARTLHEIAGELLSMYGASRALIASREAHSHRLYVGGVSTWTANSLNSTGNTLRPMTARCIFMRVRLRQLMRVAPETITHTIFQSMGLDQYGLNVRDANSSALETLSRLHYDFERLMTVVLPVWQRMAGTHLSLRSFHHQRY